MHTTIDQYLLLDKLSWYLHTENGWDLIRHHICYISNQFWARRYQTYISIPSATMTTVLCCRPFVFCVSVSARTSWFVKRFIITTSLKPFILPVWCIYACSGSSWRRRRSFCGRGLSIICRNIDFKRRLVVCDQHLYNTPRLYLQQQRSCSNSNDHLPSPVLGLTNNLFGFQIEDIMDHQSPRTTNNHSHPYHANPPCQCIIME